MGSASADGRCNQGADGSCAGTCDGGVSRAPFGGQDLITLLPTGSRVLTVGDGDFVFSEALANSRQPLGVGEIVATTLDSEQEIVSLYAEAESRLARLRAAGAEVICGVDATLLGQVGHLECVEPFDRIVFNFPLLPVKAHPTGTRTLDVHVANRRMLVEFLRKAPGLLKPDGFVVVASKECFPYSWWRFDMMPDWAGGELQLLGSFPWQLTEYPTLYAGPCNVNKDASVKPTDAVIFVYARPGCTVRLPSAGSCGAERRPPQHGSMHKEFRCDLCKVRGMRSESELAAHSRGKIHQKRVALERRWEESVGASKATTDTIASVSPPALESGVGAQSVHALGESDAAQCVSSDGLHDALAAKRLRSSQ